jgi:hypothetical protein
LIPTASRKTTSPEKPLDHLLIFHRGAAILDDEKMAAEFLDKGSASISTSAREEGESCMGSRFGGARP